MHIYALPLRARFRGITVREGMVFKGEAGWAEFSPFRDYGDVDSVPWWRAAKEAADCAWPAPLRDRIPVNATVPAVQPEQVAGVLALYDGCITAKVKVAERGAAPGDDEARLEAVRDYLGSDGLIRVDANGGWDVDTAVRMLPLLDKAAGGLEYAEQPCPTVEDLAEVRRRTDVPIAADESIRRAEDPMRVVKLAAADIAVLKVQPLGGVYACLRIAEQIGLPVVVSSALETSVGMAACVALAAALPELPYACGLGTVDLFENDVVADPLVAVGGSLPVRRPEPDLDALAETEADRLTQLWWTERLARVVALGEGTLPSQGRESV